MDALPRKLALTRFPDGKPYWMEAFDHQLERREAVCDAMLANCSQGPVWERIFSGFMPNGYTRADAVAFMGLCNSAWEQEKSFAYGLFEENGLLVGMCELKAADEAGRAEIGYWLNAARCGAECG